MRRFLVCLLFIPFLTFHSNKLIANSELDSLKSVINSSEDLSASLLKIEEILPKYIRARDTEIINYLFTKGFELANKLKSDTSIGYLYLHKGTDEYYFGNYIQSKANYQEAIDIYSTISNETKSRRVKLNEANAYNNIAIINKKQGLYSVSLINYQIALSIRKEINDSIQIANTYMNIGNLYNSQRDISKALEYYDKAKNTYQKLGDEFGLATATHNLGLVHELQKEYPEALLSYKESYQMYKRLGRMKSMAISLNNIGNIYLILNKIDSVKQNLDSAYDIYLAMQDSVGICSVLINYGNYYSAIGENEKAEEKLLQALEISRSKKLLESEVSTSKILAEHFNTVKDYKKAYFYLSEVYKLENEFKSIGDEDRFHSLDEYYREEANKQNMAIKELELENSQNSLKSNQKLTIVLIVGLVIIFVLLAIQFLRYNMTNAIKQKLELTNKELHRVNEEYKSTLISKEEKEILLQEIHHRVKNNLQIINSLLRFQALKGSDEARELIMELQSRITAMSLLHEQLYLNKDFTKINVKDYLELLLSNLSSAYSRDIPIKIEHQIDVENLDLDTLHPLGLLVNEIISNSLKHAFNKNAVDAKIYLKFYPVDDVYHLEIGDNGIGFNKDQFISFNNNLGIELITSLTNQLDGEIESIIDHGTHYHIQFKKQKIRKMG